MSPEQVERIRSCKSPEEVLELAKAEGYELSDEQLEQVVGAFVWDDEERKEWIRKQKDEDALLYPLQEPSQGAASRTCANYEVFHVHEHRFRRVAASSPRGHEGRGDTNHEVWLVIRQAGC